MRKTLQLAFAVLVVLTAAGAAAEEGKQPASTLGDVAPDCNRQSVTCGSLKSCAQACGFLKQCGFGRLDRDKDGIPCESVCDKPCDGLG